MLLSERTFTTLEKQPNDSYSLKVVKQSLANHNEVYVLHGVFGDNAIDVSGKECIICLTADKDTMILPCRHLSICRQCAVQVSMEMKKCPVCRNRIVLLYRIGIASMLSLKAVNLT